MRTPRRELAKLRSEQVEGDPETRAEILDAMLVCCGETGYRRVSVEQVYRRYGGYRSQFYRYFKGKAECYAAAYELESEQLCDLLLAPGEGSCRECFEAALRNLADFAAEHPLKARGLIVEVHVAGGEALFERRRVIERLSHALDTACLQMAPRHRPPPTMAEFMVGSADQALSSALMSNRLDEFTEAIPDLGALVQQHYQGY